MHQVNFSSKLIRYNLDLVILSGTLLKTIKTATAEIHTKTIILVDVGWWFSLFLVSFSHKSTPSDYLSTVQKLIICTFHSVEDENSNENSISSCDTASKFDSCNNSNNVSSTHWKCHRKCDIYTFFFLQQNENIVKSTESFQVQKRNNTILFVRLSALQSFCSRGHNGR